jgi:hypothetical protein
MGRVIQELITAHKLVNASSGWQSFGPVVLWESATGSVHPGLGSEFMRNQLTIMNEKNLRKNMKKPFFVISQLKE